MKKPIWLQANKEASTSSTNESQCSRIRLVSQQIVANMYLRTVEINSGVYNYATILILLHPLSTVNPILFSLLLQWFELLKWFWLHLEGEKAIGENSKKSLLLPEKLDRTTTALPQWTQIKRRKTISHPLGKEVSTVHNTPMAVANINWSTSAS